MESYLYPGLFDLVTPDGMVTSLKKITPTLVEAEILIQNLSPVFAGYTLKPPISSL